MMVPRFISKGGPCKQPRVAPKTIVDSSNDDANRTQRITVTDDARNAESMSPLQALTDCCNIPVSEIMYRLDSGKVFQVTRTHPEPREIRYEDFLTRFPSRSSTDAPEEFVHGGAASEDGQARGVPRAGRHSRTRTRKRRDSSSPSPALRIKRRPVRNGQTGTKSGCSSDSEEEKDELDGAETEAKEMKICEVQFLYYEIALRSISQLVCKDIAKAWIKFCHPKKQTSHPYNGGKSNGKRSKTVHGYLGHYTMPDYWPSDEGWKMGLGCRHTEPDHVKKPERIILFLHLLRSEMKGFKDANFSLKNLMESTVNLHLENHEIWTPAYFERLSEIYRVRAKEMEFERGEIDENSVVMVQMPLPKSRCKVRKAPKPANKAAGPACDQVKESETSFAKGNVPVANMSTNVQVKDKDLNPSQDSEPSILADTFSMTNEVAPDASYAKPVCEARTTNGLPLFESPSPSSIDRRHSSVQENWTPQSANFGPDPHTFMQPNPLGTVATPREAQGSHPLRGQHCFGSSSTQSFPIREFSRGPYDQGSTAGQRGANGMRPDGALTRSPPARPVAPKVENVRHPTFVASSSGLVGAFSADADYSNWQADHLCDGQLEDSMYTAVADPNVSLLPSSNGSFSSGYSDASFSSGLQLDTWNSGKQFLMHPYDPSLDEELQRGFNLQAANISRYQPSGINPSSGGNPELANHFGYATDLCTQAPLATEHKFDPFAQGQRQL